MTKRKIYLSHPYRGNVEENMCNITRIARSIAADNPDVIPVSPLHMFSFCNEQDDQEEILGWCLEILKSCDELWLCSDWMSSKGCRAEFNLALKLGIERKEYKEVSEAI